MTAARLVWGGWAVLSLAALALVLAFGRNVPYWDDWKLVGVLLGGRPVDGAWLWDQCNEHRLPLSKLAMAGLARLSGGDLRWAMVASALLLSAVSALLLVSLRRVAGALRWTDFVLPLALLGWSHQDVLLNQIGLHFTLAVALFVGTLAVLLQLAAPEQAGDGAPGRRRGLLWALLLLAPPLPWVSGIGLCLSPALVLWMLWAASRVARTERRALYLCAELVVAGLAVLLVYLPSSPEADRGFMGLGPTAATALRCLTTSIGPLGRELWPWSGLLVAALAAGTAWPLLGALRDPARRRGALVLLAGLAAVGGLALVIGKSRAGLGWESGFAPRYTTLMAPGLCCLYLVWRLHGPAGARSLVPALLAVALLLALPFNTSLGLRQARQHTAVLDAFAADVYAGLPPAELARVHAAGICPIEQRMTNDLLLLRQRELWIYGPP